MTSKVSQDPTARRHLNPLIMVRVLTTIHIDSETTISWLPSSRKCFALSRATARALRDSLRSTTATVLHLQELLSQSDAALGRIRDTSPPEEDLG